MAPSAASSTSAVPFFTVTAYVLTSGSASLNVASTVTAFAGIVNVVSAAFASANSTPSPVQLTNVFPSGTSAVTFTVSPSAASATSDFPPFTVTANFSFSGPFSLNVASIVTSLPGITNVVSSFVASANSTGVFVTPSSAAVVSTHLSNT